MTYPVAFILSMVVALVFTPLVTRLAHARRWYDLPTGGRKIHSRPIPRVGGLAVVTAFFRAAGRVGHLYQSNLRAFVRRRADVLDPVLGGDGDREPRLVRRHSRCWRQDEARCSVSRGRRNVVGRFSDGAARQSIRRAVRAWGSVIAPDDALDRRRGERAEPHRRPRRIGLRDRPVREHRSVRRGVRR